MSKKHKNSSDGRPTLDRNGPIYHGSEQLQLLISNPDNDAMLFEASVSRIRFHLGLLADGIDRTTLP